MAVPRGYRRNSSGFIQPIGSVPSGRVSGPRAGQYGPIGIGDDAIPGMRAEDFPLPGHVREAQKKVLASYEKAQKQHEAVMAKLDAERTAREAKKEKRVDKIQKALEAERKNAPKDKLGNTIETPLAKYLAAQLAAALAQFNQGGVPAPTPGTAGITPEQQEKIRTEGPGRPEIGGAFEPIPGGAGPVPMPSQRTVGPVGASPVPMPSMEPGAAMPGMQAPPEVYPMNTEATHIKSGAKITLLGQQRMGKAGPEYLARGPDGKEAWVPAGSFQVAGQPAPTGGMERLMDLYRRKGPQIDPDAYVI